MDKIIGILILLLAAWCVIVLLFTIILVRMLSHPPRLGLGYALAHGMPTDPAEAGYEFQPLQVQAQGRLIQGWCVKLRPETGPIAIVAHGWGDSKVGALAWLDILKESFSLAILYDQRGHGESADIRFTWSQAEADDLLLVMHQVHTDAQSSAPSPIQPPAPPRPLFLFGYSMGAEMSLRAAALAAATSALKPAGVIAESPYLRGLDATRGMIRLNRLPARPAAWLAFTWLCKRHGGFENLDVAQLAKQAGCPLLVMAGEKDPLITPGQAAQIAGVNSVAEGSANIERSLVEFPQAGHLEAAWLQRERYVAELKGFIEQCLARSS